MPVRSSDASSPASLGLLPQPSRAQSSPRGPPFPYPNISYYFYTLFAATYSITRLKVLDALNTSQDRLGTRCACERTCYGYV
ncbi:hypothetical protein EV121DRAFT_297859 [Schizophyllum commune]